MGAPLDPNALDRAIMAVAPQWALSRIRARAIALTIQRHYEAAQGGRRTTNWSRSGADANSANGPALSVLRMHAREMMRNNSWARNGQRVISRNTVGWGLVPKADDVSEAESKRISATWKKWAGTTQCDPERRSTIYGMQRQVVDTISESGEVLVRRRRRMAKDQLAIPLQLQVLEPDFIDTLKDGIKGSAGGPIVQGVEYDQLGRRAAYWLFEQHPGSSSMIPKRLTSKRVPAEDILHVFRTERPGQVRGVSWYAPVLVTLKDFDEYEDATLMRQKIAACFTVFVTDVDGLSNAVGEVDAEDDVLETVEPGLVKYLHPGQKLEIANPPVFNDSTFGATNLRRAAAGLGVTYEDLTNDYSQVNFSSARMSRLAHWENVYDWRYNMLIPQFCDGVWAWAMEALMISGSIADLPTATWTPPPMPMIEPDKEGLALIRLVRSGAMTPDEMVRQQGFDPATHWAEYAAALQRLDKLGIIIDGDSRKVSQAGLTQERAGGAKGGKPPAEGEKTPPADDEKAPPAEE